MTIILNYPSHLAYTMLGAIGIRDATSFVAKVFKAKTRKGMNYFVYRFNMPKDVGDRLNLVDGDLVFFKANKAQWYHMLDWDKMQKTYQMLPLEIRSKIVESGLFDEASLQPVYPSASQPRPGKGFLAQSSNSVAQYNVARSSG
jgi:hypothetical protein